MTDQATPRNDRLRNWIGSGLVVVCCFPLLPILIWENVRDVAGIGQHDHGDQELRACWAQLNTIKTAIIQYRTFNHQLPSNEQGLWALVQPPENVRVKKAIMTDAAILDPWGNPFRYQTPAQRSDRPFEVWSMGGDGVNGTADDVYSD